MIWEKLLSKDFAKLNRKTPVILSIAAIEQHGPALPLETDSAIGKHFLRELEKVYNKHILLLPQIKVCCSQHHMDFAGTLTVSHETMLQYAYELLESASHHGFQNFIIFNSHGGNLGIGQVLLERFGNMHPKSHVVFTSWWKLISQELEELQESAAGGVGHACEFEHSLMLEIAPQHIDSSVDLKDEALSPSFSWAKADLLMPAKATLYQTFKNMTRNGIYGKPALASAEKGKTITRLVVKALQEIVDDLRNIDVNSRR